MLAKLARQPFHSSTQFSSCEVHPNCHIITICTADLSFFTWWQNFPVRTNRFLLPILLFFLLVSPCFSQTFGTITGEVKDSSGAVIAGASVSLTSTASNTVRTDSTNADGIYSF